MLAGEAVQAFRPQEPAGVLQLGEGAHQHFKRRRLAGRHADPHLAGEAALPVLLLGPCPGFVPEGVELYEVPAALFIRGEEINKLPKMTKVFFL